jgi:hypothetical protein
MSSSTNQFKADEKEEEESKELAELRNAIMIKDTQKAKEAFEEALDRHPEFINVYINELAYDVEQRYTPLQWAICKFLDKDIMQLLLNRGADMKLKDRTTDTYGPTAHKNALQLLEDIKKSCTNREYGGSQKEFYMEEYGKTYTNEWYKDVKKVLVTASAASASVADTDTAEKPAARKRKRTE